MQANTPGDAVPIDLTAWARRPLYEFFSKMDEPYHGVCLRVDCTETFRYAKASHTSFFLALVHCALTASQQVENMMTRIVDGAVWQYKIIHGGSAVGRANGTIGFGYYPYQAELKAFVATSSLELERVRNRTDLERHPAQDLIRFSVLPWLDFTSISHAREFSFKDSAPKITFGKVTEAGGRCTLPVSIHVHHALADGLHVAQFTEHLERLLTQPETL